VHPFDGPSELLKKLKKLQQSVSETATDFDVYRDDPVGFVRNVLKGNPTPDQEAIMRACIEPPYRIIVRSGHNVGKSWLAACMILWFARTQGDWFRLNSTANTYKQIDQAVWGEVRHLDKSSGLNMIRGVNPIIRVGPRGIAEALTADSPDAFQGRRGLCNGLIVDEAIGVKAEFFPAMESILAGKRFFSLYIFNPTDSSSHLRLKEENKNSYRTFTLNQQTHPNIDAARRGLQPPYPSAISLEVFEDEIRKRSDPVIGEPLPTDIEIGWKYLPDGSKTQGEWRRPNPEAECRNLGRWPSVSTVAIWSPELWRQTSERVLPLGGDLQVGVDVARFGSCNTAFAVRKGSNLLALESYNGWNGIQTANRAKELCFEYGRRFGVDPRSVPVVIDGTGGWGSSAEDQGLEDSYRFISLVMGEKAIAHEKYVLLRDELWCALRETADEGKLSFKMLPGSLQDLIRPQALAAKYEYRGLRKKVIPKEEMAESLAGRSPDEFEAVLLAFANVSGRSVETVAGRIG